MATIIDRIVDTLGRVLGRRYLTEKPLHLSLHAVYIEVANHHNGLQVRAVPLVIVVAQVLISKVVHHVHTADGHAVLVLGATVDTRHDVLHKPLHGHARAAVAPLLVDNATFLVHLTVFTQYIVAPGVEDEQTGVYDALAADGGSPYVVHGLVDRGVSVEVGPKLDPDRLAPGHYAQLAALAREVLGTIKRHVLQEVGQATLARLFEDATHALGDVEVGQASLLGIVADVVSKPILQLAGTN